MASQIDPTVPVFGTPTTQSVRDNFSAAKSEIDGLMAQLATLGDLALLDAPLAIGSGGTGATDAASALLALGGAPLASPALTGTPTAPTPIVGDNSATLATTAYVKAQSYITAPVSLTTQVSGILPVGSGGTGLAAGNSGGIPYYSAAGAIASSAALAASALVVGGGAGATPFSIANWTAAGGTGLLRGNFMTAGAVPGPGSNPATQLLGADNGFPVFNAAAWGTGLGYLTFSQTGGTGAAPAATVNNQGMGRIVARGYDTAYLTADSARIEFTAAETFSTTGRGARIAFSTVAAGTTTLGTRAILENDGGLLVPNTVTGGSRGLGTVNVSGGYYLGGVAVSDPNWSFTAAHNYIGNFSGVAAPGLITGGVGLQVVGGTSTQVPGFQASGFGAMSLLNLQRADGTPAAPAAIVGAERLSAIYAYAYDGSAYQNVAAVTFEARQAFSGTQRGTGMYLWGTPSGSTTITTLMSLGTAGGGAALPISVTGGDMGLGTVNVSGAYYIGGARVTDALWTFSAAHTLTGNSSGGATPALVAGTGSLQLAGPAAQALGVQINAFAALAAVSGIRADGTPAAPTAIAGPENLMRIAGYGYNGSTYAIGPQIMLVASQAWSGTAQGNFIDFYTTPNNATAPVGALRLQASGGLSLPSVIGDTGAGTINVSAGYYLGGAAALTLSGSTVQLGTATLTGPLTLAADPTTALGAATKQYVDNTSGAIGGPFVPIAGATMTGQLNVNLGAGPLFSGQVQGIIVQGADNPSPVPGVQITRYGGTAGLQLRTLASGGTAAAPTAVAINTILGDWFTLGYSGTLFRTGTILRNSAAENWTGTAGGANFQIITTQLGSTTQNSFLFHGNGSILNPTTVTGGNTGAGTINVSAGYYIGGVNIRTGVVDGSNAAAGQVGEYLETSLAAGSPVNISNNTVTNVLTLSLTPGDWLVTGNLGLILAASNPGATVAAAITTVSATLPAAANGRNTLNADLAAGTLVLPTGDVRVSISATASVYLVGYVTVTAGTVGGWGMLCARRMR